MASPRALPIRPQILKADLNGFLGLGTLSNFQPFDPALRYEAVAAAVDRLRLAEERDIHTRNAQAVARSELIAAQWAVHDLMGRVKDHVKAQFGSDSDEIATLGLKRKSHYKPKTRRTRKNDEA